MKMKKVLAMILALAMLLCSASALAAGKINVSDESFVVTDGYSTYAYIYARVENTGDKAIKVNDGLFEVYDADGNAIGTRDWVNKFAEYLQPGESTYVYTYTSLDGKTSADVDDYAFTVSGKSDNSSTSVRLPVSTDLAMNVQDGWWTYNYMYATVTNNTEEVIYKIETVLVLQDAEGKPLYMTSDTMYDEGLVPGSSVVIRKSIDSDTLEYWQAKGVEPASVDAIAFVTVENK